MMADLVIAAAAGFALALTLAWAFVPGLRAWLERPKYRFQHELLRYDRQQAAGPAAAEPFDE
jgi:hypothetical protein